ncbi:MAG: hypothetical protein V3U87_01530 [Methylococcaceae bacterium]
MNRVMDDFSQDFSKDYETNLKIYRAIKEDLQENKEASNNIHTWYAAPEAWALAQSNDLSQNLTDDYLKANGLYFWIHDYLMTYSESFKFKASTEKEAIQKWLKKEVLLDQTTNDSSYHNKISSLLNLSTNTDKISTLIKESHFLEAANIVKQHKVSINDATNTDTILGRILESIQEALTVVDSFYIHIAKNDKNLMSCTTMALDAFSIAVPDAITSTGIAEHIAMLQYSETLEKVLTEPNLFEVLELMFQMGKLLSASPKLFKLLPYKLTHDTAESWINAAKLFDKTRYLEAVANGVKVINEFPIDEEIKDTLVQDLSNYENLSALWIKEGASLGYSRFSEKLAPKDKKLSDEVVVYFDAISLIEAQIQMGKLKHAAEMIKIIMDKMTLPKRHLQMLINQENELNEVYKGLSSGLYVKESMMFANALLTDIEISNL